MDGVSSTGGDLVHLGEFGAGAGEADFESFGFAEPAVELGFGDSGMTPVRSPRPASSRLSTASPSRSICRSPASVCPRPLTSRLSRCTRGFPDLTYVPLTVRNGVMVAAGPRHDSIAEITGNE